MASIISLRPVHFALITGMFGDAPTEVPYRALLNTLEACGVQLTKTRAGHTLLFPVGGGGTTVGLHRPHKSSPQFIDRWTVIKVRNDMRDRWGWSLDTFRVIADEDD
ncbi:hypothetical protein QCA50_013253 [Cerrena zonata]|uniref:Uncharacterized protein n=1 Tax=Cerrena zonata TaxID=2478898 RepID=A0AAW0FP08_9APHY